MEAGEVGEWTDNDRTQCNFKLSHKFYSQDALVKNKIKIKNASQGLWGKLKLAPTKCSQTHFLMNLSISYFLNLFSKEYFMLLFGKHAMNKSNVTGMRVSSNRLKPNSFDIFISRSRPKHHGS